MHLIVQTSSLKAVDKDVKKTFNNVGHECKYIYVFVNIIMLVIPPPGDIVVVRVRLSVRTSGAYLQNHERY